MRSKCILALMAVGRYDDAVAEQVILWTAGGVSAEVIAELKQTYQKAGWQGFCRKEIELTLTGKLPMDARQMSQLYLWVGDK